MSDWHRKKEWYRKLLLLLMMASDPKEDERERVRRLADDLLVEWLSDDEARSAKGTLTPSEAGAAALERWGGA
jgi:hypothetical protein